jgi:peptidoglycan/LPS O-acetylase OafA/YrhL
MGHSKQSQIVGLDLVRCAAALLVMLHHFFGVFPLWVSGRPTASTLTTIPYTWFGWVGVQVFFVISGFVIAYSSSYATATSFLRSRFLRLFPTLWICSCITLCVALAAHTAPERQLLQDWLHSIVLNPWHERYIDHSYWTLPVEISFYAIIFLLLATKTFRFLNPVIICLGLFSTASLCYSYGVVEHLIRQVTFAEKLQGYAGHTPMTYVLLANGVYFALGTELWLFLFERKTAVRAVMLPIFTLGGIAGICNASLPYNGLLHRSSAAPPLSAVPPVVVWVVSLAAIVSSVVFNSQITRSLRPFGVRSARRLGVATYPIYLLHQTIGLTILRLTYGRLPYWLASVTLMLAVITFCMWVLPWIENPIQSKFRGWLGLSKGQTKMPAAMLP